MRLILCLLLCLSLLGGLVGCETSAATGNNTPVPNAGASGFAIPRSTPFELTGSATDVDGDGLQYVVFTGDRFIPKYYVVGNDGAGTEGSYGTASSGAERPVGSTTCVPGHEPGCP